MNTSQTLSITALFILLLLIAISAQGTLTIGNTRSLSFGSFVADTGGTVTLSPGSDRSSTGAVVLVPSRSGHSAQFTVQGDASATYTIELPADYAVALSGPGADMALTNFTSQPSGAGGQLDSSGSELLSVGATLEVSSDQLTGDYSGSFSVTVNYN